ncbi:hypothetical protein AURANDRAFT_65248 [Aureococcus anophagefferens]|uniref:Uncharacterized protein n=1 Tax=Aureococcus anophagefferens TaxID=44056 RepID=F0YD83_AURAN|nr:hypothetical protein AURANDRAFT_65248 [Aureococcus anophagefferens]EGB07014.1 hypothetical protein AURANDRAFT_65248 [Aureococcus anophagefferens]|eukprot:XP_009038252.1 hypothetical protein AURANDRAFT_65248 [Aureococcus anophagefferens]
MPELGDTAEPGEAPERAPRADARRLTTRLRPLEDREIDRDPLARFTHATPVPKLGALRLPERTSNKLLTDSFPAGFLARAKAARVLEVSGDYDAATNPYGSRVLKPGFRFADALVGTARGRHAALDELPGAPSFGAVEYYSLPSPGGAFRRAPVSQLPLAQRVFDVPDLPKRSPRLLVDDRSLVVEDELDRRRAVRRGDDDDLGSARSQRSYAELSRGAPGDADRPASRALTVHLYSPTPTPGVSSPRSERTAPSALSPASTTTPGAPHALAPAPAPGALALDDAPAAADPLGSPGSALSPALTSTSPFFVNGTFDADGRLNVSLYEDAENVSAKFSRNGDSSGPGSIPREQERIMATKYDDGESISVASYAHSSRASSVAPGTPFTIGSALGLVRTELREVLSREKDEGVPQPRSAPVVKVTKKESKDSLGAPSLRSQKTAPSQVPRVAERSSDADAKQPSLAEATAPAAAAPKTSKKSPRKAPCGPSLALYVKASRKHEEDSQTSAVPVTVFLEEAATLRALGRAACGALGVAPSDRVLDAPDFSICYRHPVNRRTIILLSDGDWRDAFRLANAQGGGELRVIVDLPAGLLRPPSGGGAADVAGKRSIRSFVEPPRKIDWRAKSVSYTLDSHLSRLDPTRERPAPKPAPKPVSAKERRRRIAEELASRLTRGPPA